MSSSPRTRERRPSRIELAEKLTYGAVIVNVYILNMFMGTGPIALPYGFQVGGMLLSSLFLVFVAVTAYITGTFVVETLVITNVLFKFRDPENVRGRTDDIAARALSCAAAVDGRHVRVILQRPVFELVPTKNGKKVFRATDPEVWQITKRIEIGELGEVFFSAFPPPCAAPRRLWRHVRTRECQAPALGWHRSGPTPALCDRNGAYTPLTARLRCPARVNASLCHSPQTASVSRSPTSS